MATPPVASCSSGPVPFQPTSTPNLSTAVLPFNCPGFPTEIANAFFDITNYTVRLTRSLSNDGTGTVILTGSVVASGGETVYSFTVNARPRITLVFPECFEATASSSAPPRIFPPPAPPGIALTPSTCTDGYTGPYVLVATWHPIPNVNLTYTFTFTSSLSASNPNGQLFDIVQGVVTTVESPQVVLFQAQLDPSEEVPPPGQTSVPQIDIIAYSSLDRENLGEVKFTVKDIISYKCIFLPPKSKHQCKDQIVSTLEIIETVFVESPDLNRVVKGKGCTLQEKTNYLRAKYNIPLTESQFLGNVIAFGLLKYILARLMYGDFNLKYLLRCFNNEFIRDLNKSRFCLFVDAFVELGLKGYSRFYKRKFAKEKFDCCCSNNAVEPRKEK
ncbi:Hypothetical protein POVR1_LOCUS313 [uncultured virus]|nr:Hypothetical protein POVR1_LOCUS313 [uncultured virus]